MNKRSPLVYLLLTRMKNSLLGLIKKPAGIIYLVVMAAAMVMVIVGGNKGSYGSEYRDVAEVQAGASVLFTFLFFTFLGNGFSNGGSIFTLSDVNLLFTSPMTNTRVLVYGLFQQMTRSLLLGLFILFQYSWLHGVYGQGYFLIILLVLGYGINVFMGQLCAMVIYAFSQRSERIASIIKGIYWVLIALYVLPLLLNITKGGDILSLSVKLLTNQLSWFPVTGWLSSAIFGQHALLSILLCLGLVGILVFLMVYFDPDYYEDVLLTAETTNAQVVASKEGRMVESAPKHIKLGKVGLNHGKGASAIYFKHRLENRRAKATFIGGYELLMMAVGLGFAYLMRDQGMLPGILFGAYMQVFSVILGRFNKEICKSWVYLIPERPFSKLFFTICSSLETYIKEAVIFALVFTFIFKGSVVLFLGALLVRFSFAVLILSIHIIMQRLFGALNSKALIIMFYFLFFIVLAAIGVVVAAITVGDFDNSFFLFIEGVVNLGVGLLALFICRNVLSTSEFNS